MKIKKANVAKTKKNNPLSLATTIAHARTEI